MSEVFCLKCGSDVDGVHYANCEDHPTNIALRERIMNGRPERPVEDCLIPETRSAVNTKANWFKGKTTLEFDADQIQAIYEYFLTNVLDITGVKVVKVSSADHIARVTFESKQDEVVYTG